MLPASASKKASRQNTNGFRECCEKTHRICGARPLHRLHGHHDTQWLRPSPAADCCRTSFFDEQGQTTRWIGPWRWITAREYFKQVVETYTQSPFRPDAKLAVGDTYLEEGGADNLVLAMNEYREFLSFYPTNKRADYAQYKLAMTHFKQMRAAERDQSETRDAIKEFQTFVVRYPASTLMTEGKARLRESLDRLSQADFRVGYFYFRQKWYPGSIDRLAGILKNDPEYTSRDEVYFYLAGVAHQDQT